MNYLSEGKIPRRSQIGGPLKLSGLHVGCVLVVCRGRLVIPGSYGPVGGLSSRPGSGGGSLGSSSFHPQGSSRNNLVSQWPGEFRCQHFAYSLE